jgi:modulator of FtsH protease
MNGWQNVFLGVLGASTTLTGLIFVGVSINLSKIMALPDMPNRALEALVALIAVLFISLLLLIPGQSFLAIGIQVLLIGMIEWITMLLLQVNSLRRSQPDYRHTFILIVLVCQAAALSFVMAGIILLIWGTHGLYWIVAATILSFLAAFADSWVLLIEINR